MRYSREEAWRQSTLNKSDTVAADISSLAKDITFKNNVAQIRAKALLREVSDQMPETRWTYNVQRLLRNLSIETLDLEDISDSAPEKLDKTNLKDAAYNFALAWESLSKLGERVSSRTALFNAAITYRAFGLPSKCCLHSQTIGRRTSSGPRLDYTFRVVPAALFPQSYLHDTRANKRT